MHRFAEIAQLVEQPLRKRKALGSSPSFGFLALIAQLEEHRFGKAKVPRSIRGQGFFIHTSVDMSRLFLSRTLQKQDFSLPATLLQGPDT